MLQKYRIRGAETKGFSSPGIQGVFQPGDLLIRDQVEIRPLGQKAPDETIAVFIQSPLPRVVGSGKKELGAGDRGNLLVMGKLRSYRQIWCMELDQAASC